MDALRNLQRHAGLLILLLALGGGFCAVPVSAEMLERGVFQVVYGAEDAALAEPTMQVLEEAVVEFGDRLPTGDATIRVIIVESYQQFAQFAPNFQQADVSGVAKSAQGVVAVKPPRLRAPGGDYRGTVRHELVHVLLHRNVETANLPRWLNEGLCMSLANEYRWASMLEVGKMFLFGRVIPYRQLDLAFLAPGNDLRFGNAYAQALSMTRTLRNDLGEDAFWRMILSTRDQPFPRALEEFGGMTVNDFIARYYRSLWLVAVVSALTSGSLFGPIAVLAIVAYFRKRHTNRKTLQRWAIEEAEEDADPVTVFDWDQVLEDADAWKKGQGDDGR